MLKLGQYTFIDVKISVDVNLILFTAIVNVCPMTRHIHSELPGTVIKSDDRVETATT